MMGDTESEQPDMRSSGHQTMRSDVIDLKNYGWMGGPRDITASVSLQAINEALNNIAFRGPHASVIQKGRRACYYCKNSSLNES